MNELCGVFWGSHACDLRRDHVEQDRTMHRCSDCCNQMVAEHGDRHGLAHREASEDQYGADGCAGMWPYYGRKSMVTEESLPFWRWGEDNRVISLPNEFEKMKAIHDNEAKN